MVSLLSMSLGKMSDFVSFPLFGFSLVMKLRSFDIENFFKKFFKILKSFEILKLFKIFFHLFYYFLINKKIMLNLSMSCQVVSNLVSFSWFELNFGNKLRNANFKLC